MPEIASRFRLDGQVAVVTGAARGIGRATAEALARAGARVAVTDIDGPAADATAAQLASTGLALEAHTMDVTNNPEIEQVLAAIAKRHGRLDILVNNAGTGARQSSTEIAMETWERVLAVNLSGAFACARVAARHMLPKRSGAIVNVASIMGFVGGRLYPNPAYHASKGGLVNLTRAQAIEWAPHGVRVNGVAPAFVATTLTEKLFALPGMRDAVCAGTPMGRLITLDEVAATILFLASPAASGITGSVVPVDGGWLAQ
jgi:NAD(P)-dependent dehydrogenase (short-subunit alcohol dehydrogenase family)